ncbi:MAG: glycosyltransferase family 2 protein [Planctomycetes bacterium]|nr:glycosyltransferase family 2 protein [Planctomycetota bacterium]
MDAHFDVSALVVNYNTAQLALDMLRSLRDQRPRTADGRPLRIEWIFVDNASPVRHEDALESIRELAKDPELPGQVILHDQNAGYAGGMNLAWKHARGTHALVLNPDLLLLPRCVEQLWQTLQADPSIGIVGPVGYWDRGREVLLPPNVLPTLGDLYRGTLAQTFRGANRRYVDRRFRAALDVYRSDQNIDLPMLSGACLLVSREQIERMGGLFDDGYPLYYEDTDLFRRATKSGKRLVMVRHAEIAHFYNRSGTTNPGEAMNRYWRARRYYFSKWYGVFGRFSDWICRKFLNTKFAERARARTLHDVIDLGDVHAPPTIELPRHCESYVLELCQDRGFLLAAAIPGSGATWTPGASFWAAFGESEYYFRAVDLTNDEPEELGVYRFRRVPAPR